MEAILSSNNIKCYRRVFDTCLAREETAESVVPDTMPDILQIIDTDGLAYLRSKEAEQGRAVLSGNIGATVVYQPEGESGCRKLSLTIPYTAAAESAGITENCKIVATVRISMIEARILNPRKVLIRAEITVSISCYEEGEIEICDGLESDTEIQTLISSARVSPVIGVEEKTFVLSDEYQLPAAKPIMGEMLKSHVDLMVDDIKTVGNKLVFKGAAQASLMYAGAEDNEPASVMFTTSFSQIIEMEGISEQPDALVSLMMTGAYFEPMSMSQDNRIISAEIHVVAQVVCSESTELSFIADAYSNQYTLNLESRTLEMPSIERRLTVRETVREVIETPQQVREVVGVYTLTGTTEVIGSKVKCPVTANVIYRNDGENICCISRVFTVESSIELEKHMEAEVIGVICAEVYSSPAAGGLEVRMPVDVELLITEKRRMPMIVSIEIDEENVINTMERPSVTVLRSEKTSDLWTLAKRYGSTPELIIAANDLTDADASPGLLLIPRAR